MYVYYIQSIEDRFYPEDDALNRVMVKMSYQLELAMICNSLWSARHLAHQFVMDYHPFILYNGVNKSILYPDREENPGKHPPLRILVEGPLSIEFKRVKESLELCRSVKSERPNVEVWYLGRKENHQAYSWVDKIFFQIPEESIRKIYSNSDVLFKMSTIESLPLPHIEMMVCGGTVVSCKATGVEEICTHEKDSLLVELDDFSTAKSYLLDLYDHPEKLQSLKQNALLRAKDWPDISTQVNTLQSFFMAFQENPVWQRQSQTLHLKSALYFELYTAMKEIERELRYYKEHFPVLKNDYETIIHSKRFRFINALANWLK